MPKILNDGRIQVEDGDTLSGIYGSNWKEASGYSGDPTQLQVGTILPAKPVGSLGGSMVKEAPVKSLPKQPVDNLSVFGDVLKMVTQRAAKESVSRGGEAMPEGMLGPNQVSGNSFANVLKLTQNQKTRGMADIYESTIKMIDDTKQRADDQLKLLIDTGAISKLDDDAITGLANMTGFTFDQLSGVRDMAVEDSDDDDSSKSDFTSLELRKLEQAGIDPKTDRKGALDLLYGNNERGWEWFSEVVDMNQDASYEELLADGAEKTNLSDSDLAKILAEKGFIKEEFKLTDEAIKDFAIKFVKDKWLAGGTGAAIKFVNDLEEVDYGGKMVSLTKQQKKMIIDKINELYPEGRTVGQRLMPGGK